MKAFVSALSAAVLILGMGRSGLGSEVIEETGTRVIVREHPKTGRPYVSIIPSGAETPRDPFGEARKRYGRPDYRMLDPKVKSGQIAYEGPWSDRKKVYIFAASLMTVGVVGGGIGMATAASAAGSTAAGGGGAYVAAGTAVTAGSAAVVAAKSRPDPHREDFDHTSQAKLLEEEKLEEGKKEEE